MHEYGAFFAFRPFCPFRPVCPVEPISAFYGQDGQEACVRELDSSKLERKLLAKEYWKRSLITRRLAKLLGSTEGEEVFRMGEPTNFTKYPDTPDA